MTRLAALALAAIIPTMAIAGSECPQETSAARPFAAIAQPGRLRAPLQVRAVQFNPDAPGQMRGTRRTLRPAAAKQRQIRATMRQLRAAD
jgi:hypothetical protein